MDRISATGPASVAAYRAVWWEGRGRTLVAVRLGGLALVWGMAALYGGDTPEHALQVRLVLAGFAVLAVLAFTLRPHRKAVAMAKDAGGVGAPVTLEADADGLRQSDATGVATWAWGDVGRVRVRGGHVLVAHRRGRVCMVLPAGAFHDGSARDAFVARLRAWTPAGA